MPDLTTLVMDIPALIDQPAVGTSCCVTSAEALVAQELWMLPGINDTQIDARSGRVTVTYDDGQLSPDDIKTALGEVGYPAVESLTQGPPDKRSE